MVRTLPGSSLQEMRVALASSRQESRELPANNLDEPGRGPCAPDEDAEPVTP